MDKTPPVITDASLNPPSIVNGNCTVGATRTTFIAHARDPDDPNGNVSLYIVYTINGIAHGPILTAYHSDINDFEAMISNVMDRTDSPITVDVYAFDRIGNASAHATATGQYFSSCPIG